MAVLAIVLISAAVMLFTASCSKEELTALTEETEDVVTKRGEIGASEILFLTDGQITLGDTITNLFTTEDYEYALENGTPVE